VNVGLTGGLGSGKSTVTALLGQHGAVIIDADVLAREVVRAGTPGFAAVVARFGPGIIGPDGELDRAELARIVFADSAALADLNAIVHPLVGSRSAELAAAAPPGSVVVHDIPLLTENGLADRFDTVVVVEADREIRLARLAARGLPRAEAVARMAAQANDAQRRAIADEIVRNDDDLDSLARQIDKLWDSLSGSARSGAAT
jgi:dephospho-CoA kinase